MQAFLTERARWPWWLGAALAGASVAMWWRPWIDDTALPAPAPAPALAQRTTAAPDPDPAPTAAPVAVRAPALELVGTAVSSAGSFATVRRATDSQFLQLRVGDRIDGLTVTAIEPGRIVLAGAAKPLIVIEADASATAPVPPRAARPAAAPQAEQPVYADGEAPWDAGADFRH